MKRWGQLLLFVFLVLSPSVARVKRHDPLTYEEIDQLREVAQEPEKRLKLLADFARVRMTAIEQSRTAKKPEADNARSLHDLMEDFLAVYDELDENISMYEERESDLRKALKPVLVADSEFHARLEGLQHNLTAEEHKDCDFVLTTINEAISTGTADHKKLLADQEAAAKNKKKK